MLINKCKINIQRHQDSIFFKHKYHADQAEGILSTNCIHLISKETIIFLNEQDVLKIEALQPIIKKCSIEQIINLSNQFTKPYQSTLSKMNTAFEKRFGWFFKNGNK